MSTEQIGKVVVNSTTSPVNNIVSGEKLREVQSRVLRDLKNAIINSMGPMGSNTLILRGTSDADIVAEYSKDGNKIIKSIKYQYPIEMAIKSEIENATRRIEKEVGDGTSSVVVMASLIFDNLVENAKKDGTIDMNPYDVIRIFKKTVEAVGNEIRAMGRDCTLDDIYNIAYISTNGNVEVAKLIQNIYKDYGMGVFIDVSASTNENTYVKSYNGVTIEAGYSDPCMINSVEKGTCKIRSTKYPVHVYHFADPMDTPEQLAMFQQIIETNVIERRFNHSNPQPEIPTVILVPQISRDAQAYMRRIVQMMHQFDESQYSQKPQLLVVTNYAGLDENYVDHISTLCGCTPIKKYIDEEIHKQDQEAGLAPNLQNVVTFFGTAEEVEADASITKFVNPKNMYELDENGKIVYDDNGPVYSKTYQNIVNFLEAQYKSLASQGGNVGALGSLKRQLNAVKSNMVELFIGGISISDRDSLRDLVEDAVLNTRSAAQYGVGYGANTMGYYVISEMLKSGKYDGGVDNMLEILLSAYREQIHSLYSSIFYDTDNVFNALYQEIIEHKGIPYNMYADPKKEDPYDGKVLTSIESEPMILDTIAKIVTIMFTANQAVLQAPSLASHY